MKTSANPGDEQVGSIAWRAAQDSLRRRVLRAGKGAGESVEERGGRPSRCMRTSRRSGRAALRQCTDRWALLILFLVAVCGPWAEPATAQARRSFPKIGELWSGTESSLKSYRQPYVEGMRALGWIDRQTATFVVRYDNGDPSRLPALAAELLGLGIDVLVVNTRALPAARKATTTIPIVCLDMFDPIAEGVTSTLARAGGNVTGVSWQSVETGAKRLELAKELLPGLKRVALLTDAEDSGAMVEAKGLRATAARYRHAASHLWNTPSARVSCDVRGDEELSPQCLNRLDEHPHDIASRRDRALCIEQSTPNVQ